MSDEPKRPKETDPVVVPARRRREGEADGTPRWVGLALVIGLAMVAAAIAGVVLVGMQDNAVYAKPVDELVKQKTKFAGRPVRAEGMLVHGTLTKRETPCEYRF